MRFYGFQWHVWDQTKETLITAREVSFFMSSLVADANISDHDGNRDQLYALYDSDQGLDPILLPTHHCFSYQRIRVLCLGLHLLLRWLWHRLRPPYRLYLPPSKRLLSRLRPFVEASERADLPQRRSDHRCCCGYQHSAGLYYCFASCVSHQEAADPPEPEARTVRYLRSQSHVSFKAHT